MKIKPYKLLFYLMLMIMILLIASWSVYLKSNADYLGSHPDINNEWGVFAILGMMISFFHHGILLIWSTALHFSYRDKKSDKFGIVQFILILILGLVPSIYVLFISITNAVREFNLAY